MTPSAEFWRNYWEHRDSGGHRHATEEFLRFEAIEKLALLDGGDSLLDFGCGAAEMLSFFAPHYEVLVGADFSPAMLEAAERRLRGGRIKNVQLVLADDTSVWSLIDQEFSRITAGQVVQYFDQTQLLSFVRIATQHLKPSGRIVLFDIIDPRLLRLFELGLIGPAREGRRDLLRVPARLTRLRSQSSLRKLRGLPAREIGRGFEPGYLMDMLRQLGLRSTLAFSHYYEYRYHLIARRASDHGDIAAR